MSTTSIQAQLGYAAQASPVALSPHGASDRNSTQMPQNETAGDEIRATKSAPVAIEMPGDKTQPSVQPRPELQRMTRKTDIDWMTNSLVYRVIDNRSGQVVSQSPDEALLRLRAYAKQALTQSDTAQFGMPTLSREL